MPSKRPCLSVSSLHQSQRCKRLLLSPITLLAIAAFAGTSARAQTYDSLCQTVTFNQLSGQNGGCTALGLQSSNQKCYRVTIPQCTNNDPQQNYPFYMEIKVNIPTSPQQGVVFFSTGSKSDALYDYNPNFFTFNANEGAGCPSLPSNAWNCGQLAVQNVFNAGYITVQTSFTDPSGQVDEFAVLRRDRPPTGRDQQPYVTHR